MECERQLSASNLDLLADLSLHEGSEHRAAGVIHSISWFRGINALASSLPAGNMQEADSLREGQTEQQEQARRPSEGSSFAGLRLRVTSYKKL